MCKITILLSLALTLNCFGCQNDESRSHLTNLRKIAGDTPVYPGFERTGENIVEKRTMLYLFVYFQSEATFAEVKSFYDRELPERSWKPEESRANSARYRKGDYVIAVEKDDRSENNFDIVFEWDPN
jgi:hypothetical protein